MGGVFLHTLLSLMHRLHFSLGALPAFPSERDLMTPRYRRDFTLHPGWRWDQGKIV